MCMCWPGEVKEEVCLKIMEAVILREKKDKDKTEAVSMIDKSVFRCEAEIQEGRREGEREGAH